MLDLKLLRENPDLIRDALKRRGNSYDLDSLLKLEKTRREHIASIEQGRQTLKQGSEAFAKQKAKTATATAPRRPSRW